MKKIIIVIIVLIANCVFISPCMSQTNINDVDKRLLDKKAEYVALNFMNALINLNYRDAELYKSANFDERFWNEIVKYCQTVEGRGADLKKLREYRFLNNLKIEIFYKELCKDENNVEYLLIWMNNYDSQGNGHDSGRVGVIEEDGQWKVIGYNF